MGAGRQDSLHEERKGFGEEGAAYKESRGRAMSRYAGIPLTWVRCVSARDETVVHLLCPGWVLCLFHDGCALDGCSACSMMAEAYAATGTSGFIKGRALMVSFQTHRWRRSLERSWVRDFVSPALVSWFWHTCHPVLSNISIKYEDALHCGVQGTTLQTRTRNNLTHSSHMPCKESDVAAVLSQCLHAMAHCARVFAMRFSFSHMRVAWC